MPSTAPFCQLAGVARGFRALLLLRWSRVSSMGLLLAAAVLAGGGEAEGIPASSSPKLPPSWGSRASRSSFVDTSPVGSPGMFPAIRGICAPDQSVLPSLLLLLLLTG